MNHGSVIFVFAFFIFIAGDHKIPITYQSILWLILLAALFGLLQLGTRFTLCPWVPCPRLRDLTKFSFEAAFQEVPGPHMTLLSHRMGACESHGVECFQIDLLDFIVPAVGNKEHMT